MIESGVCSLMQNCLSLFWGEAMMTVVDLINLSPSYPLEGDIPERIWIGKFVSFEYLRVFGCRAFVIFLETSDLNLTVRLYSVSS